MLLCGGGSRQKFGRTVMKDKTDMAAVRNEPTRRQAVLGAAMAFGGLALVSPEAWANPEEEISHTAESIHQEVVFKASRERVYRALTDSKQFEHVVHLSDAMKTRMPPGAPPTRISPEVGGAFSTFGGLIVGRNIELVPNQRIVQAWRPAYWKPGVYSIAKFELAD